MRTGMHTPQKSIFLCCSVTCKFMYDKYTRIKSSLILMIITDTMSSAMQNAMDNGLGLATAIGSGIAVKYFGLDRAISWLPKFVSYGAAGGVAIYALEAEPNWPASNMIVAMTGSVAGIVGGEVANFLM